MDDKIETSSSELPVTHNWDPDKYKNLVEETSNPFLKEYEDVEKDYIENKIENPQNKTFIDVGAGGGRALPFIAPPRSRNVIAVEYDPQMLTGLKQRVEEEGFSDITAVQGDANHLSEVLRGQDVVSPVVMCLQNSLGTWIGNADKAIIEMRKAAQDYHGEVIISILHQEALRNHGVEMYRSFQKDKADWPGEIDLEKTDFEKGIFRTKSGYLSKWRTKEEREAVRQSLGGKLVGLIEHPGFSILHLAYN